MTNARPRFGLLLVAHGERGGAADNAGVAALTAELARREVAAEVRCGFINGVPPIGEALQAFATSDIMIYPLFLSDGYFARVRLRELLADSGPYLTDHRVAILPALGLDPQLAELIAEKVTDASRHRGESERRPSVVLLAHGSLKDGASRHAAEALQQRIGSMGRFSDVLCAFLEEPPALRDCISELPGQVVVVGLFAGDGLHGAQDVPRLIEELARADVLFINVGTWPEIAELVVFAVQSSVIRWGLLPKTVR